MHLTQPLHRAIRGCPERIATLCAGRRHSYRTFVGRVARMAGALQALGIRPGDRIAILSLNSDRYLELLMASFWAGAAAMPLNSRWSNAEVLYALNECAPAVLMVDDNARPRVEVLLDAAPSVRHVIYAGDGDCPSAMHDFEQLATWSEPVDDALRNGDDLALVIYTGGTTGLPKGVMLSHRNLYAASMAVAAHGCSTTDIYLHAAPMFHMADLQLAFCHFLHAGTHAVIPAFNPSLVADAIERERVTDVMLVPTMIQLFLDQPGLENRDLSSLSNVTYGAAPITGTLLNRALGVLPGASFIQGYGMTETCLTVMLSSWHHTEEGQKAGKLKSAGNVMPTAEIKIIGTGGEELAPGEAGELAVRGPTVMLGYWNKPEETQKAIVDGWMHTGDCAYMDQDGFVFVVDRIKDMIITGGENVYSGEVENILTYHPAVAQCAVIAIPDEKWGESVHAVVVARAGVELTVEELQSHCRQRMAGYKCPRSIEFRSALPLSAAGKVLKAKLREEYQKHSSVDR